MVGGRHALLNCPFLAIVRSQTGASEGKFWIGLSRVSTSSRFQWDDGSTMFWSNFDANFPKDNNYVTESTINGKWQTLDGVQKLVFVCSYDPSNRESMILEFTANRPSYSWNCSTIDFRIRINWLPSICSSHRWNRSDIHPIVPNWKPNSSEYRTAILVPNWIARLR